MLTKKLAEFIVRTDASAIPVGVLEKARDALSDTLSVIVVGATEDPARLAQQWIRGMGAKPIAGIYGTDILTSPAEAAFANCIAAHAIDFDDSMPTLRGHPSAPLVSVLLALGEAHGPSGREVLVAYALALEFGAKLGRALGHDHYMKGWHTTATVGVFTATAASARILGLSVEQLMMAWGMAASMSAGLVRNFGSMTKPLHVGHAARSGLMAAELAKLGFTADAEIFDLDNGYLSTYDAKGEALADLIDTFGKTWEINEPGIYVKRWPCCHATHRTIAHLLDWHDNKGVRAKDVSEIAIGFSRGSDRALIKDNPQTGLEAKFSIEYIAAAAIYDGQVTLNSFDDAAVQRPELRALMKKVRRYEIPGDKVYSGVTGFNDIAVTASGETLQIREERGAGSPNWPLSAGDRRAKFMDCTLGALGRDRAESLFRLVEQVETLSDIRQLTRLATLPQD